MGLSARLAAHVNDHMVRILRPFARAIEDRIMSAVSQKLSDLATPPAYRGVVLPGTYDPTDGTAEILIGSTYALIGDDGDVPATLKKVPLLSTMVGDLAAPIGGERVILYRDFGVLLHHGEDDTPGVASGILPGVAPGERIIGHRNPTTLAYDSFRHLRNDGATAGDGLGGVDEISGAYHKTATAGGLTHEFNDETKQLSHIAGEVSHVLDAGAAKLTHTAGPVYTLFDGNGNVLSHVAAQIGLGDLAANLPAARAAIANADVMAYEQSHFTSRISDQKGTIMALITAMMTSGVPSLPTAAAAIAQLATLTHLAIPSGSSVVKVKA